MESGDPSWVRTGQAVEWQLTLDNDSAHICDAGKEVSSKW